MASGGVSSKTRNAIEEEDRHQMTGDRRRNPPKPKSEENTGQKGLSNRMTAQEAAAKGDRRFLEILRRRRGAAAKTLKGDE